MRAAWKGSEPEELLRLRGTYKFNLDLEESRKDRDEP